MTVHKVGTRAEWRSARKELLDREKVFSCLGDELARQRRQLPWVRIEKQYSFETDEGTKSLAELFDRRSQLLVYHFVFGSGLRVADDSEGCTGSSFLADHFDGAIPHLNARDVTMLCVSRAPLERLHAYKRRMGWRFPWVSSLGCDFNFDLGVSFTEEQLAAGVEHNFRWVDDPERETHGLSAFALEDGVVYHTHTCYARGTDALVGTYQLLDRTPRGRDEDGLPFPQAWWRRHDEYEELALSG
jgi:predicted dithiol-disulfide oxidoreductase (DUF899 family)